jgi:amino acid transporter
MLVAALSGATIHEAYIILIDMTAIMSLLPLTYILLAFPLLRRRTARMGTKEAASPLGTTGTLIAGCTGFAFVALAIITSMIPPDGTNTTLFLCKVVGGSAFLISIGLVFYWRHRLRP